LKTKHLAQKEVKIRCLQYEFRLKGFVSVICFFRQFFSNNQQNLHSKDFVTVVKVVVTPNTLPKAFGKLHSKSFNVIVVCNQLKDGKAGKIGEIGFKPKSQCLACKCG
jgi:hypothetical protein